jgi:hypothetical protein
LGELEPLGEGIGRCRVLRRLLFLVSGAHLPVDRDSLPMHVLGRASVETETAVARLVGAEPLLWKAYGDWVLGFHPQAIEELWAMARGTSKEFRFHFEPLIELFGLEEVLRQLGPERVLEHMTLNKVVEEKGLDWPLGLLAKLTPAQRRELKRRLQ